MPSNSVGAFGRRSARILLFSVVPAALRERFGDVWRALPNPGSADNAIPERCVAGGGVCTGLRGLREVGFHEQTLEGALCSLCLGQAPPKRPERPQSRRGRPAC